MALHDLINQVSIDLNDHASGYEFTTWSEAQLTAYVIEGLQIVFAFRPDLFMHAEVVRLQNGTSLQRPCDCAKIRRIYGVCSARGQILYPVRKRSDSSKLAWYGHSCPTDPRHYRIYEYSVDASANAFYVHPAPPAGQDTYMLVECARTPSLSNIDADGIPQEAVAPTLQWALYRAKMVDSENNNTIFTVAIRHKEACFQLLNVQLQLKDLAEIDSPAKASAVRSVNGN